MGGLGLTLLFVVIGLVVAAGVVYQLVGVARDAKRLPPPGKMIDVGGPRLHVEIAGEGTPPVVFEAGIAATCLSWRLVQPEVARTTQTVSYDRAGLGWSDRARTPRSVWNLVEELRTMLDRAGVVQPRVIAAHSFGGLIALGYAARYPDEVAALVLVDPVPITEWAAPSPAHRTMLGRGIFLAGFGEVLAHLGVVRFALDLVARGSHRLPKLIARASSGRGGAAFTERMAGEVRKLPREVWPAVQSHWCDPKCFRSMRNYLQSLPESAAAVLNEARALAVPLVVLSADNSTPAQRADHERVARLSVHGRLEVVRGGHWIMLDRPDIVGSEILRMLR